MSAAMLGTEFASNVFGALILALVLALTRAGRLQRIILATVLGLFAWVSIVASYWNWDRFPTDFAAPALVEQITGWLLGGVAIALILGRPKALPATAGA